MPITLTYGVAVGVGFLLSTNAFVVSPPAVTVQHQMFGRSNARLGRPQHHQVQHAKGVVVLQSEAVTAQSEVVEVDAPQGEVVAEVGAPQSEAGQAAVPLGEGVGEATTEDALVAGAVEGEVEEAPEPVVELKWWEKQSFPKKSFTFVELPKEAKDWQVDEERVEVWEDSPNPFMEVWRGNFGPSDEEIEAAGIGFDFQDPEGWFAANKGRDMSFFAELMNDLEESAQVPAEEDEDFNL